MRSRRLKILIADDEPDILLMLRLTMEAGGHDPLLAGDGETALRRIREERPDIVLLDVMMPVLDGWGVLEALAATAIRPHIIVITAKSNDRDLVRARDLGADEYVTKPFDPSDLMATIERVCASPSEKESRATDELPPLYGAHDVYGGSSLAEAGG